MLAGEAGAGKTSLVRAFCDRGGVRRGGAVGRVRRAVHTPATRAAARPGRRAGGRARRPRSGGMPALTRSSRRSCVPCVRARPRSWCSRTSTGWTRRRSMCFGCSRARSRRAGRSCSPPTATTRSIGRTRCGSCSARSRRARRHPAHDRATLARCGRASLCERGLRRRGTVPANRRQPLLRDRGPRRRERRTLAHDP